MDAILYYTTYTTAFFTLLYLVVLVCTSPSRKALKKTIENQWETRAMMPHRLAGDANHCGRPMQSRSENTK